MEVASWFEGVLCALEKVGTAPVPQSNSMRDSEFWHRAITNLQQDVQDILGQEESKDK